jgi:hypothetical protein
MKISHAENIMPVMGKIMMGFVLAAMVGSINVAPALGEDGRKDMGKRDNNRYEQNGREHDRDRHVQGRRDNRPHGRERVYVPPRVIYAPPPPPGIGIFFPPIFIHP